MSMLGQMRSTSATLYARLRREPSLVESVIDGTADAGDLGPALDLDKAWHGVHFLIAGEPWQTRASEHATQCILGGEECGDDLGYGPARLLGPAAVAAIAAALPEVETLRPRFDPHAFAAADIYPTMWERDDPGETWRWLADTYEQMRAFYRDAAAAGRAVVLWLE